MTTKKIPISFNDQDQKNIQELIDLLGLTNTYGDVPKAVKFGINLALASLKSPSKVYTALNDANLELYFKTIAHYQKRVRLMELARSISESAKKV